MKKVFFILLVLTFVSCRRARPIDATIKAVELQSDVKEIDTLSNAEFDKIKFRDYVERIPQIDLPLKFSCDSGLVWVKIEYENNVIMKYKPEGAGILGKLFQEVESVGIIYTYSADVVYPIVHIYNMNGDEREKVNLFELRDCVSDLNYNSTTRGLITKDLEFISTIEKIECDDRGENCDTTRTKSESVIF